MQTNLFLFAALQTALPHCSSSPDTQRGEIIIYDGGVIDRQKVLQDVNETDRMDQDHLYAEGGIVILNFTGKVTEVWSNYDQ